MKKILFIFCMALASLRLSAVEAETAKFTVAPGEKVSLPLNYVRTDVELKASFTFKKFQSARIGCGAQAYTGGWMDVTNKDITPYKLNLKKAKPNEKRQLDTIRMMEPFWHGVKIKKELNVTIRSRNGSANVLVESQGREEESTVNGWWAGGAPFVINTGTEPFDVEISFTRLKADEPVWFYGDSYFSTLNQNRWPYYMYKAGYKKWMADHIPGGGTEALLECFKNDLKFGTPKYAVWMLGMNDGSDKEGKPTSGWLKGIKEFISICESKGITPILTTIPTVPARFHDCKTEWVRNSGCRYIDWYEAVGTDSKGNWKEGYLSNDKVHPTKEGAAALWKQVKKDLPELEK